MNKGILRHEIFSKIYFALVLQLYPEWMGKQWKRPRRLRHGRHGKDINFAASIYIHK